MYSLALLLRMHGCFSRLVLQLEKVRGLRCRHQARPPSRTSCAIRHGARGERHQPGRTRFECADEFRASDDEDEQVRSPPIWYSKLRKNWEEFREVFDGPYDGRRRLVHYCINTSCCKGCDDAWLRRRMVASLLAMLLATLPCVPVKSKWLQPGPCVDWFLLSMVTSVLQGLWPPSFRREKKTRSFDCMDADAFGYQELAGVRMKAGEDFVINLQSTTILIVVGIVSEPLRFLTRWFLSRRSHACQSKTQLWQTCPLMDLVNVQFRSIVRVLQYFASSCLRGDAPRLRLLWERFHESFAELVAQPSTADELAMLRRALVTAYTWT